MVIPSLREEFLELLEKDKEFRYAVIGYLGLNRLEKTQVAILEEIKRIWQEVKSLREEQNKLWQEVKALREEQGRLWKYIKSGFEGIREALGISF